MASPHIPYRIVPRATLERLWASGRTFRDDLERRQPRALERDKPVEEMTLDELIKTQRDEPLSESRRMFLHLGVPAYSGDTPISRDTTTTLFEFVADCGPKCLFDKIDLDLSEEEVESRVAEDKYFTPYVLTDIITRKQIDWEKRQAYSSAAYRTKFAASETGSLTIENAGSPIYTGDSWPKIVKSVARSFLSSIGRVSTYDEFRARTDLLMDIMADPVAGLYYDPDAREEADRYLADADRNARYGIEHSSYEMLDDEGNELVVHRSPRHSEWELWHNQLPRHSSDPLELGMDCMANEQLEALLGITEWDAEGNPLDSEREQLIRATA